MLQISRELKEWIQAIPPNVSLHQLSLAYIIEALILHRGNRTHTARYLKIPLKSLRNKIEEIKALRIEAPEYDTLSQQRLDYSFTAEHDEELKVSVL